MKQTNNKMTIKMILKTTKQYRGQNSGEFNHYCIKRELD